MSAGLLAWAGLLGFLLAMVIVDLKVGSTDRMTIRSATAWSVIWVVLALVFGAVLWVLEGTEAGETYVAGYVIERALSLDNVFVFALIFSTLGVPREEQPRVLLWGILIALGLRAVFIFAGAEALEQYSWTAWPFAAVLAWTGWRVLRSGGEHDEGAKIVERVQARFPAMKPAAAALVAVAVADVIFAVDSVPAILAITTDTFIVFSANAFALLGLRALFFLVVGAVDRFAYLEVGLGVLLIAIAGKLAYGELTGEKISPLLTLAVILGVLAAAVVASLIKERRGRSPAPPQGARPGSKLSETGSASGGGGPARGPETRLPSAQDRGGAVGRAPRRSSLPRRTR